MVGYHQTNQKTDTGKTLTRWPVFVDHFKQISAFRTTNRAWGIQCDRISQAAWVVKAGERVDLEMDHLFLYCEGDHFVGRDDAGRRSITLDKFIVYQHISHQPH